MLVVFSGLLWLYLLGFGYMALSLDNPGVSIKIIYYKLCCHLAVNNNYMKEKYCDLFLALHPQLR